MLFNLLYSMSLHRLEPLLHACARWNGDVLKAVDAVKAQLQCDALGSSDDLFMIAARQWNGRKDTSISTLRFLVLVVACEWESQLLQFLLQHHASDAVDDVNALYSVCVPILQSNAAAVVLPVLDVLLAAVVAFTLAYSHVSQLEEEPSNPVHPQLLNQVPRCPSCLSSRFPLAGSIMSDHTESQLSNDPDHWTRFLELSSGLDARKFDSKRGRALSSAVAQVVEQQQRLLAVARLSRDPSRDDAGDDDVLRAAVEKMHDVATQVLHTMSLYAAANTCGKCIDRQDAGIAAMPWAPAHDKGVAEIDLIPDDAALEIYLLGQARRVTTAADLATKEPKAPDINMDDSSTGSTDELDVSCFQKLLKILSTDTSLSTHTLGGVVQKTEEELSLIADQNVLGVQVSFLLAAQMRSQRRISELDGEVNKSLTRQVLREFNSLTDGAENCDRSVRALLILSGFCPSLVLREIVSRAMTAPQQVQTYVQILELCPLLTGWTVEGRTSPLLICELQSTLRDLVSAESSFEAQRPQLLSLMCALAGVGVNSSAAVLGVQTLAQEVLLPVFSSFARQEEDKAAAMGETTIERSNTLKVANFFAFLRAFFSCAVADIASRALDSETTKTVLALLLEVYGIHCGSLTVEKVELRNTLLLTIKDLLKSISSLDHAVVSDILKKTVYGFAGSLDEPLVMLVAHFSPETQHTDEVVTLFQKLDDPVAAQHSALDLEQASRATRLLLWKLLWSTASPSDKSLTSQSQNHPFLSDERAWELLKRLAMEVLVVSSVTVVFGRALVQKELACLMLVCRTSLFTSLSERVLPRLVQILDQLAPLAAPELKLPEQLRLRLDTKDIYPAISAALECDLPVSHLVMKLVSRSWSLLIISSEHFGVSESELVLQMGRHFLVSCDHAISDSKSSLAGLLDCFQWVCFVMCVFSSLDDRTKELETYNSTASQLNVTLLRLLHLLSQIILPSEADASFSQQFVASWMVQLPQGTFEQARDFISSAARNST